MSTAVQRLKSLTVADVMCREIVEVAQHQTMEEAAETFAQHGISSAPVVDDAGRCVGMLSASDFLKRDRPHGDDPLGHQLRQTNAEAPLEIDSPGDLVARYMTTAVQAVSSTDSLLHATRIMNAEHIHHLPVIDGHRAVGVVSTMDVVAALLNAVDEMDARA